MKRMKKVISLLVHILPLTSLSPASLANTSGIISIRFPPKNKAPESAKNVSKWGTEDQLNHNTRAKDGGLGSGKEGAKLVVKSELPFKPQQDINHRMKKPKTVTFTSKGLTLSTGQPSFWPSIFTLEVPVSLRISLLSTERLSSEVHSCICTVFPFLQPPSPLN